MTIADVFLGFTFGDLEFFLGLLQAVCFQISTVWKVHFPTCPRSSLDSWSTLDNSPSFCKAYLLCPSNKHCAQVQQTQSRQTGIPDLPLCSLSFPSPVPRKPSSPSTRT
ncbi:hypothetical protein BC567DRAFT_75828 [Phyllosticta citribraziliensis]